MTQIALVTEVLGSRARVQVKRVSACAKNCEQCGGGCSELTKSAPVSVLARNPLGARAGDRVVVASGSGSILGMAALVYLLPLVLFFAGYFAAKALGAGEGTALGAGGACFALLFAILIALERYMKQRGDKLFTIVEICKD